MLARRGMAAACAMLLGSCSGTGPTTPTPPFGSPPPPPASGIRLVCPPSLLVGEANVCTATFTSANGQVTSIPPTAAWSVEPADVARIELSRVTGLAAGTATVRVTHEGQSATADIAVKAEDGLVLALATTQSSGIAHESATIDFSGYYSVVSADSGTLELVFRAADGRTLSTARRDVSRGGGPFLLQNHMLLPSGAGRVCGEMSLRIGQRYVEPTGPIAGAAVCITVTG